jgi:hypothetical protein
MPLHGAGPRGQHLADRMFPGPPPLACTQPRADAVREECSPLLVPPGLGPRRVIGVQELGEGLVHCHDEIFC